MIVNTPFYSTQNIVRACSMRYPYEGYRSVTPLDAARVNRTIFHTTILCTDTNYEVRSTRKLFIFWIRDRRSWYPWSWCTNNNKWIYSTVSHRCWHGENDRLSIYINLYDQRINFGDTFQQQVNKSKGVQQKGITSFLYPVRTPDLLCYASATYLVG